MNKQLAGFILVVLLFLVFGIVKDMNKAELIKGGLYSISSDDNFKIVKILVVDPEGVHISLYKNTFPERPGEIDSSTLEFGSPDLNDESVDFGIAHMPITKRSFYSADPVFIKGENVDESELDGYNMWKEASSSYFDFDF